MIRLPQPRNRPPGFTLLELCIVLFIMALMAGAAMPALRSAFTEQALRNDGGQVARLVKTAMLSSTEQQHPYVLSLEKTTLSLEQVPEAGPGRSEAAAGGDDADRAEPDTVKLDHALQFPDETTGRWAAPAAVSWRFEPNGLCPVPRLRVQIGEAYLEMSFNALTGDVEDESLSLP